MPQTVIKYAVRLVKVPEKLLKSQVSTPPQVGWLSTGYGSQWNWTPTLHHKCVFDESGARESMKRMLASANNATSDRGINYMPDLQVEIVPITLSMG